VTEANLTNIIGALRRVLGQDVIGTLSKHGYRLILPVAGEPGIAPETYDRFTRANNLTVHRSPESIAAARELYWLCLADDPGFAAAWAWLGRCCWFRAKFSRDASNDVHLAEASFKRAFALNPDLACAHQFFTPVEADLGYATRALARLRQRLERHRDEPETLVGLVQVLRFCGLPGDSLQAHARAVQVDPTVTTGIPHTLFLMGNYQATIDAYSGRTGYYLDAAAWATTGDKAHAATLLRDRLQRLTLSGQIEGLMNSLLALLEDRFDDALKIMESMVIAQEPEILVYLARHYSYMEASDLAMRTVKRAAESGFVCPPCTLEADPWLKSLRVHPQFTSLLRNAERLAGEAKSSAGWSPQILLQKD
jgi:tetratricopeptide (TPR) repeat protein